MTSRETFAQRCLGAVDLAIDFATLGEYGLEPLPEDRPCRERSGHPTGWEALATARLRGCNCDPRRRDPSRLRLREAA